MVATFSRFCSNFFLWLLRFTRYSSAFFLLSGEEQDGLSSYSLLDVSVADDTCLAFKQYLNDTSSNTTLSDLLPCADLASSSSQYLQIRQVMQGVLTTVQSHQHSLTTFFSPFFYYIIKLSLSAT